MNTVAIIATLSIVGSIVGSILLNVFSNVLTKWLEQWQVNRSLVSTKKSITNLSKELEYISILQNNLSVLYLMLFRNIFVMLGIFFLSLIHLSVFGGLYNFPIARDLNMEDPLDTQTIIRYTVLLLYTLSVAIIPIVLFSKIISDSIQMINKVLRFDEYKSSVEARIIHLETKLPNRRKNTDQV